MIKPDISFVVPSFQSRPTIGMTLDSIRSQKTQHSFEIIVVDSSSDDTAGWIQKSYPDVQVIDSVSRLFPGAARNAGAGHSLGHSLAFVDADARLDATWLETIARSSREFNPQGLTGGWVSNANPQVRASRVLHWIEFSEFLPGFPSGWKKAISSSNLFVTRESFRESGGFNEDVAMSEDLILSKEFAGRIYFEGDTGIHHRHRSEWGEVHSHLHRLGYWSGHYRRAGSLARRSVLQLSALTMTLSMLRAARILRRTWQADRSEGLNCLHDLPGLWSGLARWSQGFEEGLTGRECSR